jgi:hypothetical protein
MESDEATELDPFVSFRCPPQLKEKAAYLARHDTKKFGRRVSLSHIIRRALREHFQRRARVLYPEGGEHAD